MVKTTISIIAGWKTSSVIPFFFLFVKTSFNHFENTLVQTKYGFILCNLFDNVNIGAIPTVNPEFIFNLSWPSTVGNVVHMLYKQTRAGFHAIVLSQINKLVLTHKENAFFNHVSQPQWFSFSSFTWHKYMNKNISWQLHVFGSATSISNGVILR